MSSAASRAVFISYSSDDVEAAQRIATALQEAGIEVWFDRSELRGGDAWDQNIRRQIKECALFLPIISPTTERRPEGYFRLEWRLADNRTHHMGRTKAFLVPVCIDGQVNQAVADVPDSFLAVHWTLLTGGEPNQGFVDNLKTLLSGPAGATRPAFPVGSHAPVAPSATPAAAAPPPRRWLKRLLVGGAIAAVLVVAGFVGFVKKAVDIAEKRLAVLPFDDLSETPGAGTNFADGLQAALITNRALMADFTVAQRPDVAQYRENPQPIPEIAQKLIVGYFIYGTITRVENKAEVSVSLISGRGSPLWNKTYSQLDLTDSLALRTSLANAIATDVKAALAAEREKSQVAKQPTGNANAFSTFQEVQNAFARGDRLTPAWLKAQERKLQGVVSAAPDLASAWALLATVHSLTISQGFDMSDERVRLASESIDSATDLDPNSPDTIRAEGIFLSDALRDYPGAIAKFQQLHQALTNSADSYGYLGAVYRRQGQWQEAQAQLRTATDLDKSNFTHLRALERLQVDVRNFLGARQTRLEILRLFSPVAAGRAGRGGQNDFNAAIPLLLERPEESYRLAVILLRGQGATAPGDRLFSDLTPEQAKLPRFIALKTDWLRLTGHLAEAVALDAQQPAFGDDGEPAWRQAIDMAAALAANNEGAKARARLEGVTAELQARLLTEPGNARLHSWLGLAFAVLDDKDNALRAGNRAVDLAPDTVDAVAAADAKLRLAIIQSWVGDIDAALAGMTIALSKAGCEATIHSMKLDPWFARMRADPRFGPLLSQQNHTTLFPDFGPQGGPGGPGGRPFPGRGGGAGGRGQAPDFNPSQGGRDGTQPINGQIRGGNGQRGGRQGGQGAPATATPGN